MRTFRENAAAERLFGRDWREEWVTLFDDSTIAWFKEKDRHQPEGSILVKEAPEMTAAGQWTLRIPGRPELPSNCHFLQLMAFGNKKRDKVHWLLAKNEEEVNDWMTAISNTLPPPPVLSPSGSSSFSQQQQQKLTNSTSAFNSFPQEDDNLSNRPEDIYSGRNLIRNEVGSNLGNLTAGVLMGAAFHSWGRGWGWLRNWDPDNGCYNNDQADITASHHFDYMTGNYQDADTYSWDDYEDIEFGCGDYGMDCSADFGF
ncbi:hypothetical protein RUM43_007988 [Polyplax serrata]|uniref:PH domain-containing protein n=1 Tax=Polyplax serrata TaxID=468196 RepID=A0AAN8PMY1_POLSC